MPTVLERQIVEQPKQKERNMGIEALRLVAMFMVVMLHVLGRDALNAPFMSVRYLTAWLMEIASLCAVNCYALISGYVGIYSRFKPSRLLSLWLQTLFYSLLITLIYSKYDPAAVDSMAWTRAFFPVTTETYWYITAYFGMYIMVPFLNAAVNYTTKKQHITFVLSAVILFSIVPVAIPEELRVYPYGLNSGYSMAWLCILYIIGGALRKYGIPKFLHKWRSFAVYVLAVFAAWGVKTVIELFFSTTAEPDTWHIKYISLFIFISSIALFCFFAQLDIKPQKLRKVISFFAPASLGVYLIHIHPYVWYDMADGLFPTLMVYSSVKLIAVAIVCALAVFVPCLLIERFRLWLFSALRVQRFCGLADRLTGWVVGKIAR